MSTPYVLVTRYEPPGDEEPVVNVYGPFLTKGKADAARRSCLARYVREVAAKEFEARVRKIIDTPEESPWS